MRGGRRLNIPDGDYVIFPGDRLQVIGSDDQLARLGTALNEEVLGEEEDIEAREMKLKQKLAGALQELGNKREQRVLDWNKALLDNQEKREQLQLEIAKAEGAAAVDQGKLDLEAQKVAIEAQDRMEATISDTNQMMGV